MRIARIILAVVIVISIACMPGAGEISGASKTELSKACSALSKVGYDYWRLDMLSIGGRILEVAADIHTAHPGPKNTQKYCNDR